MKKKKMLLIILICCLTLITACTSDFKDCYNSCRANQYMKQDFDCQYISSDLVKKNCGFNESIIINTKDYCHNLCLN